MKKIKEFMYYFMLGFKKVFTSYIFQGITLAITLLLVSITVYKAVSLRNKVDKIEKDIEEKMETTVEINYPEQKNMNSVGAAGITNCLKTPMTEDDLTDELKGISKELENLFNESNYNFAFKYKDMFTGFSLSYNSKQPIFAASTIKAPEAIYIYEKAEDGEIDLEEVMTYTPNFYSGGTGVLKDTKPNTDYTIKKLTEYSIIHSDNIAHLMLNSRYKSSNIYSYWTELGTREIFKNNGPWGAISADDGTITMEELYKYYSGDNKYDEELLSYFERSWKVISIPDKSIKIASKSGWSENALHDMALILDENPYTLVILTNRGYTEYQAFFNRVSTLIYNFHKAYWEEKINICTN